MIKNKESGFVALFFVLMFASVLGFLVLGLSLRSKNMLVLFENMRGNNAARVAANYCLQKILTNKLSNIGYRPLINTNIEIREGLGCRYMSFIDIPHTSTQKIVVQLGMKIHETNILRKFTVHILGTYSKGASVLATTSHEIIKEFYITDSL